MSSETPRAPRSASSDDKQLSRPPGGGSIEANVFTELEERFFERGLWDGELAAEADEGLAAAPRRSPALVVGAVAGALLLLGVAWLRPSGRLGETPALTASTQVEAPLPRSPAPAHPAADRIETGGALSTAPAVDTGAASEVATPTNLELEGAREGVPASRDTLEAVAAARDATARLEAACQNALAGTLTTTALQTCGAAFDAHPAPALASRVAMNALERGHEHEARDWARRALAVDPRHADAYVFLGGAEQELGRPEAARAAYRRYLELAPAGPYANDVRMILDRP